MRRRDVHQSCLVSQFLDRGPIVGDPHRSQHRAVREKQLPRRCIAGLFDADFVFRIEQKPRAQVQCLLRAADDDNLFG